MPLQKGCALPWSKLWFDMSSSFPSSAISVNSARASRPTSFSGNLQNGLGWTAGGPWCLASCAGCQGQPASGRSLRQQYRCLAATDVRQLGCGC